jgi:hypothetical protein
MNKDLYDKKIELPEDVVGYLGQCFDAASGANENTEGYKRNKELRDSGHTTYQQLKRMKNWFDSFNGRENELPFILNGGHYVKGWVDKTLGSMRGEVDLSKEIKSTVLPNQYIQPHQKNNLSNMNRPSKEHGSSIDDLKITEDIKRINNIIKKII